MPGPPCPGPPWGTAWLLLLRVWEGILVLADWPTPLEEEGVVGGACRQA